MIRQVSLSILCVLLVAGIAIAQDDYPQELLDAGSLQLLKPDLRLAEDFKDSDAWENYENDARTQSVGVDTRDQVYVVEVENQEGANYIWGQDYRIYGDSVIQVQTEQLSDVDNNAYGVMCRADPSNNSYGYYFMISGDGMVNVYVTQRDSDELVYSEPSEAINQGQATNLLTVVCVQEYLAFYVNDQLEVELQDKTFREGAVAFAAIIFEEDETVEVTFDNLRVWEVDAGEYRDDETTRDDTALSSTKPQTRIATALEAGGTDIDLGDLLSTDTWDDDQVGDWAIAKEDDYYIGTVDEGLLLQSSLDSRTIWTTNGMLHDDVVITVEVERRDDSLINSFGILCRSGSGDSEDGYAFEVSPDGYYAIGFWEDDEFISLGSDKDTFSDAITPNDTYTMTIVCVDDYLALYVDGALITEVEDDRFSSGYAGLIAAGYDETVEVRFDNFIIWEASD